MAAALKDAFVRKPVLATIRLVLPAGAARTGPPVSPALGPYRVNLMALCKEINARTQRYKPDTPIRVTVTVYRDSTFQLVVKPPSVRVVAPQEGRRDPDRQPVPRPRHRRVPHRPPRVRDREAEAG
jgi:ribosomal protein L11